MWPLRYARHHNDKYSTKGRMIKWHIQKVYDASHWIKTTWNIVEGCLVSACTMSCAYLSGDGSYKQLAHALAIMPHTPSKYHLSGYLTVALGRTNFSTDESGAVWCKADHLTKQMNFPMMAMRKWVMMLKSIWLTSSDSNAIIVWTHD